MRGDTGDSETELRTGPEKVLVRKGKHLLFNFNDLKVFFLNTDTDDYEMKH